MFGTPALFRTHPQPIGPDTRESQRSPNCFSSTACVEGSGDTPTPQGPGTSLKRRLCDTQASAGASGAIVRLIEGWRRCRGIPFLLHGSSDGPKFLFLLQVTTGLLCGTLGFTPPEENIPDQQGGDSREEPSQSRAHGFSQTSSLVHGNMLPGQQSNEAPATSTHRLAAVFREGLILPFFHLVGCNRQPSCPQYWPLPLDCPGLRAHRA